jgi:L-alanine-DL-glutamate epimerase-like enolase superfamily enzyme
VGVETFPPPRRRGAAATATDDLDGLRQLRAELPLDVTAGEYGYSLDYFREMLRREAVDVAQADMGRCAGITEWLRIAGECAAFHLPLSTHCEPALHLHAAAVPPNLRHMEYFASHVRFEETLFDGVVRPRDGALRPPDDAPGNGLSLRRSDTERYRVA